MANPTIFIENNDYPLVKMFTERGYKIVRDLLDADIVCFSGGSDVYPGLYRQEVNPQTRYDINRDNKCIKLFNQTLNAGKPIIGICRGSQFVNVMNGGTLWQHVTKHAISGTHTANDHLHGKEVQVTSTHHQMMIPAFKQGAYVTMSADLGSSRYDQYGELYETDQKEIESVWYGWTKSLCFQPHPEYTEKDHECQTTFFSFVNKLILPNIK